MGTKRPLGFPSLGSKLKRTKGKEDSMTYFQKTLQDCGLRLKIPPEKCLASEETMYIIRGLKKILMEHEGYPRNVETFLTDFKNACNDNKIFEYYLFPNIVAIDNASNTYACPDSVIKILLNVTFLQDKLLDFIFNKAMDFTDLPDFESWVKMMLKSLTALDTVKNSEVLATKLIDLLDVSPESDRSVRLEIISAIPDIIGDKEHDNVASELRRIMSTDSDLLPSILDCLTYLCLSDEQYTLLQQETLKNMHPANAAYFPNFVKFLLMPDRSSHCKYEETIKGIRKELAWTSSIGSPEDMATSQVLTETAIRNAMLSTKAVAKAWLNVLSNCKLNTDHRPIDIIFFLILYSISDETEKQVESVMRKQIKMQILKEDLLNETFKKYKAILKNDMVNSMSLINLANSLLKCSTEPLVQTFASRMYAVMFSELTDCSQIIVAELLKLVLNYKKSVLNTLNILNNIAAENLSLLTPQSLQILTLLDRMDDMTLTEVRAVMNLVCRLAFSLENSVIRNDVQIIIQKELGSSIPSIKIQGILAGINAVKYLTKSTNGTKTQDISDNFDDVVLSMTPCLPQGDLQEAEEIIKLINHSTKHYPYMIAFFYDELYNIIQQSTDMNKVFIGWLTAVLTNNWHENFLVGNIENSTFGEIRISSQLCLNQDSEVDEQWFVNIAGLTLEEKRNVYIEILSPLFQLVRGLHYKKDGGDLSNIDALLGSPIVMPIVDIDSVDDLSEAAVSNILDCHIHCVNWIRELLNAFAAQPDADNILKPKILNRILQLKELEDTIEKIILKKDMTYKPPSYFSYAMNISNIREQVERRALKSQVTKQKRGKRSEPDETLISETGKSQQTKMAAAVKNKLATIHNIRFRPLSLSLIELLRCDLTPYDTVETKLSFEILNYLLKHLNGSLDKILVSRIKKQTFLNKDSMEIYNRSEAEAQVKIISDILPKIMDHIDFITSFIKCHLVDDRIDPENMYLSKIMESCSCLEHIYNLLTIYFRWVEFKSNHMPTLRNSLKIFGKVKDNEIFSMVKLLESFQEHEKYCMTLSFAVSLMELMKALQEHSTESGPSILKNMAYNFLSKQWKEHDKGLVYNQSIDTLTQVYLDNSKLIDLKDIVTRLGSDVEKLRDKTSVLPNLKSINKSTFIIFFRNIGTALCDRIKFDLNSGMTNDEHVEMWTIGASTLKLMSYVATTFRTKNMLLTLFKKSIPILKIFLSKGFPILNIEFQNHKQSILDVLKDVQSTTKCLHGMFSNSKDKFDRGLTKKITNMAMFMVNFQNKTEDLLKANDCLDELKVSNVRRKRSSGNKSQGNESTVHTNDMTIPVDYYNESGASDSSSDFNQNDHGGVSDIL